MSDLSMARVLFFTSSITYVRGSDLSLPRFLRSTSPSGFLGIPMEQSSGDVIIRLSKGLADPLILTPSDLENNSVLTHFPIEGFVGNRQKTYIIFLQLNGNFERIRILILVFVTFQFRYYFLQKFSTCFRKIYKNITNSVD